jgi:hypothetical protein
MEPLPHWFHIPRCCLNFRTVTKKWHAYIHLTYSAPDILSLCLISLVSKSNECRHVSPDLFIVFPDSLFIEYKVWWEDNTQGCSVIRLSLQAKWSFDTVRTDLPSTVLYRSISASVMSASPLSGWCLESPGVLTLVQEREREREKICNATSAGGRKVYSEERTMA